MADVSTKFKTAFDKNEKLDLNNAKGYQYFDEYLNGSLATFFTDAERALINAYLPYMRDWYIQAGSGGMVATDTQNRGAFMLGGSGADNLTGGTAIDLLVGNAGNDTLAGGEGGDVLLGGSGDDTLNGDEGADTLLVGGADNDTLDGGAGNDILKGGNGLDTYAFSGSYGIDVVTDDDGSGSIMVDGQTVTGSTQKILENIYKDEGSGITFVKLNDGKSVVVDGDAENDLQYAIQLERRAA